MRIAFKRGSCRLASPWGLGPLSGLRLKRLYACLTDVSDLAPLRDLPMEVFLLDDFPRIQDVRPLADIQSLREITIPRGARNIESLRSLRKLERIICTRIPEGGSDKSKAEFWAQWDSRRGKSK